VFDLTPSPADPTLFEREAQRIADPVARLRYLRLHVSEAALLPNVPAAEPVRAAPGRQAWWRIAFAGILLCVVSGAVLWRPDREPLEQAAAVSAVVPESGPAPQHVWQVESSGKEEVYSNGLRIDTSFATRNRPRAEYPIFAPVGEDHAAASTGATPRGIVFHTTESDMAPFEEVATKQLKTLGRMLLQFLQREHSYHYLIDRFGRVYRVVEESDAANHAGFSVWGDDAGVYVNLNDSFLGVAFEGSTNQREQITAAQVTAARMLTELLRERYGIAAENCVTHAQVSVNPQNMKLANHTDWAREFPWAALNLPNNYERRIAAVEAFGFAHDEMLTGVAGGQDWAGLRTSDEKFREAAANVGATEERYRGMLRRRYQEILNQVRRPQAARGTVPAKGA
jgi:hypothetical protein